MKRLTFFWNTLIESFYFILDKCTIIDRYCAGLFNINISTNMCIVNIFQYI